MELESNINQQYLYSCSLIECNKYEPTIFITPTGWAGHHGSNSHPKSFVNGK